MCICRESSEILPRESSRKLNYYVCTCIERGCGLLYVQCLWNCILTGNLSRDDLGEPIMDVILEPGDLLYFPRGTFHQVYTILVCLCMYVYV